MVFGNSLWRQVLCIAAMAAVSVAFAAEGKNRTLRGVVKSIADDRSSLVVTETKTGEEMNVVAPPEKSMFRVLAGSEDDLVAGRGIEAYGKISEDKSEVVTRLVTIYSERDRGGDRLLGDVRADGKLVQEGEEWFVQAGEHKVKLVPAKNAKWRVLAPATMSELQAGDTVSMYAYVEGNNVGRAGFFGIE